MVEFLKSEPFNLKFRKFRALKSNGKKILDKKLPKISM